MTKHGGAKKTTTKTQEPPQHLFDNVFIPSNEYGIESAYYNRQGIVDLLRAHKTKPSAVQFIADMLE